MRLRCISTLTAAMADPEELTEAVRTIIGETLICQKDANKKSRQAANDLLRSLVVRVPGNVMFSLLCSALVGETTVMRSSAVVALSLLLLERRSDVQLLQEAVKLLPLVTMLLREGSVEQNRAVLTYIRVCASLLSSGELSQVLPIISQSLFSGLGDSKNKFMKRIRAIMRKVMRKLSPDDVRAVVPDSDLPLLEYIDKQERRTRRKEGGGEDEDAGSFLDLISDSFL